MNWSWVGFFSYFDLKQNSNKIFSTFIFSEKQLRNIINSAFGGSVRISLSDAEYIYLDYQHSTRDKNKGTWRFTVLFKVFEFRINNKLLLIWLCFWSCWSNYFCSYEQLCLSFAWNNKYYKNKIKKSPTGSKVTAIHWWLACSC